MQVGKWRESIIRALGTPISHPDHKSLSGCGVIERGTFSRRRPLDINSTDRICAKVKEFPCAFHARPLCILERNETNDRRRFAPFRLVPIPFHASSSPCLLSSNPSNDSLSAPRLRHPYFSLPEASQPRWKILAASNAAPLLPRFVRKSLPLSRAFLPPPSRRATIENKRLGCSSSFDFPFRRGNMYLYLPTLLSIRVRPDARMVPGCEWCDLAVN